ncbi:hypothetical protein ACVWXO_005382 [Bradyrhizobium sp. LM2.7]
MIPLVLNSWRWRDNMFAERLWRSVKYEGVCLRAETAGPITASRFGHAYEEPIAA